MSWQLRHIWAAIWQYLNQPVFEPEFRSVWKPSHFWFLYQIQFLENCWKKDIESESHYPQ